MGSSQQVGEGGRATGCSTNYIYIGEGRKHFKRFKINELCTY